MKSMDEEIGEMAQAAIKRGICPKCGSELNDRVLCPYCRKPMREGKLQYFRRERRSKMFWACHHCAARMWIWHEDECGHEEKKPEKLVAETVPRLQFVAMVELMILGGIGLYGVATDATVAPIFSLIAYFSLIGSGVIMAWYLKEEQ